MANNSGFMTPYQAGIRAAEREAQADGLIDTIYAASQEMVEAANAPQLIEGGKTAAMIRQENVAKLEAQKLTQRVANATNIEEVMVQGGQDIAMLFQEQRALAQKIKEDSSVSLFEDPLGAIVNAFTLPWDQQKLDAVNSQLDSTNKSLQAAHTHVQQSSVTAGAISEKLTEADLAEQATALAAFSTLKAATARRDAARSGADALKMAVEMDNLAVNRYMQQVQLNQSEETMRMRREAHDRQMKAAEAALSKINDEKDLDEYHLSLVNAALRRENKNPLTEVSAKRLKGTALDMYNELVRKGMQLAIDGTNYTHGTSIQERAKFQQAIGWTPKNEQQQSVVDWQAAAVQGAQGTSAAEKAANSNRVFADTWAQQQSNIREGSPFRAPAYAVLATTPQADHVIWKEYIAPTLDAVSSQNPPSEQFIAEAAVKAVIERKVSIDDATNFINNLFGKAVSINNTDHEFKKISGGLEQSVYKVKLKPGLGAVGQALSAAAGTAGTALLATAPVSGPVGYAGGALLGGAAWAEASSNKKQVTVDLTHPTETKAFLAALLSSKVGARINWEGIHPPGDKKFYPPLTTLGTF